MGSSTSKGFHSKKGQPVQIFSLDSNHQIVFHEDVLKKVLLAKHVQDKPVCVVSIAGEFRRGKSFFLNFLLRFLNVTYEQKRSSGSWLDQENGLLQGFAWKSGASKHTSGIWMWSEVFIATLPNGTEVGIILLDTQGSFDNSATFNESATIFALSTLISSLQIYNLHGNISSADLSNLQIFSEYAELVNENNSPNTAPFQNILFLIRDWQFPSDKPYGKEGGRQLLEDVLHAKTTVSEHMNLRKKITRMFRKLNCFLLPHPGREVATAENFDGNVDHIDCEFVKQVQDLVPDILAPQNVTPKLMNDRQITAADLLEIVQTCWKSFSSGSLPPLQLLSEATAEIHHANALKESLKKYIDEMNQIKETNCSSLKKLHLEKRNEALEYFKHKKKIGDKNITAKYMQRLEEKIEKAFQKRLKIRKNWTTMVFDEVKTYLKISSCSAGVGGGILGIILTADAYLGGVVGVELLPVLGIGVAGGGVVGLAGGLCLCGAFAAFKGVRFTMKYIFSRSSKPSKAEDDVTEDSKSRITVLRGEDFTGNAEKIVTEEDAHQEYQPTSIRVSTIQKDKLRTDIVLVAVLLIIVFWWSIFW